MLAHSMCAAEMAVDANLVPGQRNPDAAACLKLDVYRQVFDAFIAGFEAYRPLLTQVKVGTPLQFETEALVLRTTLHCARQVKQFERHDGDIQDSYDAALKQGLQCALENINLRADLAAAADVQADAVNLARSHSAADAAASKLHLQTK